MRPTPANFALDARLDINTAALVRRGLHAEALTMLRLSLHRRIEAAGNRINEVRLVFTRNLLRNPALNRAHGETRAIYLAVYDEEIPKIIRNILHGG